MINGYHAFFTHPRLDANKYFPIDALGQLASVLFWKKHFGPIHLYCDETHLNAISKYGIDKLYDSVNTTLIQQMPVLDTRYWSFSKIFLAKELSKRDEPFAILDTDLWLKRIPETWDMSADVIGLHRESFDVTVQANPYPHHSVFIPQGEMQWNWDEVLPLNCAVTYLNNPELVQRWYDAALQVIEWNKDKSPMGHSREIVFIEQRLLPTIADDMGLVVKTVLDSVFQTHVDIYAPQAVNPWLPPMDSTERLIRIESGVRHIWGMKRTYDEIKTRITVIHTTIGDLQAEFDDEILAPFNRLIYAAWRMSLGPVEETIPYTPLAARSSAS